MADTSIAALAHVDRTAGQKRVLAVFDKWTNITRHEIAEKSGLPLQSVCGRVNELLKSGALDELDQTRDGRHLLRLKVADAPSVHPDEHAVAACSGSGASAPRWVTPVIQGKRLTTMSREAALSISKHPKRHLIPDWLTSEADDVLRLGNHWRDV